MRASARKKERTFFSRPRVFALAFVVFALFPLSAEAQEPPDESSELEEEEARARFRAGRALVDAGDFGSAHEEFRRGFLFSMRPLFLFNMAECSRELGELDRARREYAEYVRRDPQGSLYVNAQERLVELGPGDRGTPRWLALELEADESTPLAEDGTTDNSDSAIERRWYTRWPFWTAVGVVVLGGTITAIALSRRSGGPSCNAEPCVFRDLSALPSP